VRIAGTTDLPDGALIDYWFWRDDAINEGPAGAAEVRDSPGDAKQLLVPTTITLP
jgi:hypothetical protein